MTTWPSELPQVPLLDGESEELSDERLRSNTDKGPAKLRRLTRAKPDTVSCAMRVTQAQWQVLRSFYRDTLEGGTLTFTHDRMIDATPATLRFLAPPSRPERLGPDMFTTQLSFEVFQT